MSTHSLWPSRQRVWFFKHSLSLIGYAIPSFKQFFWLCGYLDITLTCSTVCIFGGLDRNAYTFCLVAYISCQVVYTFRKVVYTARPVISLTTKFIGLDE